MLKLDSSISISRKGCKDMRKAFTTTLRIGILVLATGVAAAGAARAAQTFTVTTGLRYVFAQRNTRFIARRHQPTEFGNR